MKDLPQTMAGKITHNRKPGGLGVLLNMVANITQRCAWLDGPDGPHHRLMGDLGQAAGFHRWLTDPEHPAGIAIPSIQNDGNIDVEDITILQHLFRGNAVADNMVDRNTGGFGKALIVERGRGCAMIGNVLVALIIQFQRGDTAFDKRRDEIQHFGRQPACTAHALKTAFIMNGYRFLPHDHSSPANSMRTGLLMLIRCGLTEQLHASIITPALRAYSNACA